MMRFAAFFVCFALMGCDWMTPKDKTAPIGFMSKRIDRLAAQEEIEVVPVRGQQLNIAKISINDRPYAAVKFTSIFTLRADQPRLQGEVFPVIEAVTGCSVPGSDRVSPVAVIPRNVFVGFALDCGGDGLI